MKKNYNIEYKTMLFKPDVSIILFKKEVNKVEDNFLLGDQVRVNIHKTSALSTVSLVDFCNVVVLLVTVLPVFSVFPN